VRDILPDDVVDAIAKQYRNATREAVHDFDGQQGDEDSLTGALGSVLRQHTHGGLFVGDIEYRWKTTSRKLRGRGKGAPENRTSMDAIVELEVWLNGEIKGRKSLPVQSKKLWHGTDRLLGEQAGKIAALPGGGIIIDYEPDIYSAVDARTAAKAGGNRAKVPPDAIRELGDVLAEEFLECTVGSRNVYFDAERELLVQMEAGGVRATPIGVDRRVLTRVTIRPPWWSAADEPPDEP
jgi:hypothetical protein